MQLENVTPTDLRTRAAALRDERADLPEPLDAPSQREMLERAATIRRLEGAYHQLERVAQVVQKEQEKLAAYTEWRDKLAAASATLRQQWQDEVDALADLKGPNRGPGEHRVEELEAALRAVDHFSCRTCRGLFREDELHTRREDGETFLACRCGGDELDPPMFRDVFGNCNSPPILRRLLPDVDWDGVKSYRRTCRLIRLSEEKIDKAVGKVVYLIEDEDIEDQVAEAAA